MRPQEAIAICASASVEYAAVFLGALRAGVVVAPLAPGETAKSLAGMLADSGARLVFVDAGTAESFPATTLPDVPRIALDASTAGRPFEDWLAPEGAYEVRLAPDRTGLQWRIKTAEGEQIFTEEPDTSWWQRAMLRLVGPFVPEGQL